MKLNILLITLLTAICVACETELTDSDKISAKLQGQWQCEEYSSLYKSADGFYVVNIGIYPTDSNKIVIENFYGLGDDVDITVNVDGMNLNIPNQTTHEGSTIYGSGVISSNYNKIEWNYSVDIGDNMIDEVSATYSHLE